MPIKSAPPTKSAQQVIENKKEKKKEKPAIDKKNEKKNEKKKEKNKEKKLQEPVQSSISSRSEKGQPKQISEPKQPNFEHAVSDTLPKQPKTKKAKKSKENKIMVSEPLLEKESKVEVVDEHADLVQSTNAILNGMCAASKRSLQLSLINCRFQGTFSYPAPDF